MIRVHRVARDVALAAALITGAGTRAAAQGIAYVGSLQYATGDFGYAQRTWSVYLANGITWSAGRMRASASVPFVMQDAGLVQYSGAGMMVSSGGMGTSGSSTGGMHGGGMGGSGMGGTGTGGSGMLADHVGLGDPVGRVELSLTTADDVSRSVRVVAAVKAPFANLASGFGTGQWDAGAGLAASWTVAGNSVFADALYWKLGNPDGWSLRNAVAYSASVGRPLPGGHWSVLGNVTGATPIWSGLAAPVQLGMNVGYLFDSRASVIATLAVGVTHTAPALTTAVGWRVPIGGSP